MKHLTKGVIAAAIMISGAVLAQQMTPTTFLAQQRVVNLEKTIPQQFGNWKNIEETSQVVQSAESQTLVNKLYSQILSRTYVNAHGDRIMLLIAYGEDQRDNMGKQLHRPDVCYPAQGFEVHGKEHILVQTGSGPVPVTRMTGVNGRRVEPVSFWTTVGDKATKSDFNFKAKQLAYGFAGVIPDGMIVRVSMISSDEPRAYAVENQFIDQMVSSTPQTAHMLGVTPGASL